MKGSVSFMHKEFLMGNEAIAMGAVAAGVNLVSGYPGTPSSEIKTGVEYFSEYSNASCTIS